jgi:hypothetical protein
MIREHVIELLERVDPDTLTHGPKHWTIDGRPITREEETTLGSMTRPELEEFGARSRRRLVQASRKGGNHA